MAFEMDWPELPVTGERMDIILEPRTYTVVDLA
jgi:hypothetical protein